MLCFEGNTLDCWEGSYHPGDTHVSTITIPLLERAFAKLPELIPEVRVRADGAFFDHKIIEFIEEKGAFYAIVTRLTRPLKNRLSGPRYRRVSSGVWAAEFRYCPQGWPGPRRFVVIRRPVPEEPSAQLHLFQMGGYSYQLLVTNLALKPLYLWRFYNQRARAELIIRELKYAYALGKIPTKDFQANEAFFQIVLLAYNLLNWFKRLCAPAHLERATLQRLRQRLFSCARAVGATRRSTDPALAGELRCRPGLLGNTQTRSPLATAILTLAGTYGQRSSRTHRFGQGQIGSLSRRIQVKSIRKVPLKPIQLPDHGSRISYPQE